MLLHIHTFKGLIGFQSVKTCTTGAPGRKKTNCREAITRGELGILCSELRQ